MCSKSNICLHCIQQLLANDKSIIYYGKKNSKVFTISVNNDEVSKKVVLPVMSSTYIFERP